MNRLPSRILPIVALAACTTTPAERVLVLHISNELGRSIAKIHQKSCGDLEMSFEPIERSHFAPGEERGLVLPPTCVDLVAYDSRGRIVGEQRGLEMLPNARWVLRR
jgi:hypothetical protein